jgi:hypothetical protein
MVRAGWRQWTASPPYGQHSVVEAKRREWPMIAILTIADMAPEMNVAGLWWKPARGMTIEPGGIIELTKTPLGYVLPPQ